MAARKVLTRAETQAQTREDLLDAAEKLFLANGYHVTSIATIAAEAGRTVGAVYSNFANKEELCIEVLKRRSAGELSSLITALATSGDDFDGRLDAIAIWWRRVSSQTDVVNLIAEYLLSIVRDLDRRAEAVETISRFIESAQAITEEYLPMGVSPSEEATNEAMHAILATGTGLAVSQSAGIIGVDESVTLLVKSFKLWMGQLAASQK
ncbi:TetR family transcriptional regulator [Antrihabitans stalactiti]|uniref:TetR family transcriptional regulator n=1 Tax=Antrihabitans stalactiti TaxID=2584121 RepID=UPI00146C640A